MKNDSQFSEGVNCEQSIHLVWFKTIDTHQEGVAGSKQFCESFWSNHYKEPVHNNHYSESIFHFHCWLQLGNDNIKMRLDEMATQKTSVQYDKYIFNYCCTLLFLLHLWVF